MSAEPKIASVELTVPDAKIFLQDEFKDPKSYKLCCDGPIVPLTSRSNNDGVDVPIPTLPFSVIAK